VADSRGNEIEGATMSEEPMYLKVRIPQCGSEEVATMDMLDDVMAHFEGTGDRPDIEDAERRIAEWFLSKYARDNGAKEISDE